ncbi:MAG: glycine hydroxymethyltransferase [Candidatus Latescibacterota bacterium]|jgi:glycine hydroxymethyltransferase
MSSPLAQYLSQNPNPNAGFIAYLASLEQVASVSPEISRSIIAELADQRSNLKMIASENYCSLPTQLAMGNLLTDKYAEGIPDHRFYAGCDNVDDIEKRAAKLACDLFGAHHAYVQPHSGADANMVAFWAILSARVQDPHLAKMGKKSVFDMSDSEWAELRASLGNQRLLGLDLASGGHLTHGYRVNVSGRMFESHAYTVNKETGLLDYDQIRAQAKEVKPLILLAGYSAYPRKVNFRIFKEIADEVGAVFMVDMAHFAGLVAGKVFTGDFDPVAHADIVTTTTHKTLRGPRGGMVLCTEEFAEHVDKGCPMVLGGPLPHVMAAKAISFQEALSTEFQTYAARIVENCQTLAQSCIDEGLTVLTGGTDNHLMQIDVRPFDLTGLQCEAVLREARITLNKNTIPFDTNGPWFASGLRLGTPGLTTLGMGAEEMQEIGFILSNVLKHTRALKLTKGKQAGQLSKRGYKSSEEALKNAQSRVTALLNRFPLYPEIDLEYLQQAFA